MCGAHGHSSVRDADRGTFNESARLLKSARVLIAAGASRGRYASVDKNCKTVYILPPDCQIR